MQIQGKVAIITGAAQGIGKRTAEVLVDLGASVVIADINPEGEKVAKELNNSKIDAENPLVALYQRCDVRRSQDIKATIEIAIKTFGRVDILINNAGVSGSFIWEDADELATAAAIDVNLKAPIEATRQVVRYFISENIPGCVVNVASMAAFVPLEFGPAYAASKAGLVSFTGSCGTLASRNPPIRVNCVAPTFVDTVLTSGVPDNVRAILKAAGETSADDVAKQILRCVEEDGMAGDVVRIRSSDCISLHDGPKARAFGFATNIKL
ncbi:hypothetical protein J3B02_000955 [Coemansia erecta]|uniref:NAD(P)-binding protein n=1 Tax=Coemansia asiatica TaxID=1052880 RepID=A0A9W7XL22_9FUNG|nr:hypothetical protein LPJ64_003018 [Coemansia asiatica]KAJ2857517.1 hypothetical protein J3B02_000955 [Coemansia erecta]KAJ2888942.1 hypothetical protein FB639_000263 [Coemansia asiatica]